MMNKLGQPTELTKNFFEVLGENGRLYETEKVCAQNTSSGQADYQSEG